MTFATTPAAATGQDEAHLCSGEEAASLGAPVHQGVVAPFSQLRIAAAESGHDLVIHSGFRSFERQLSIWNRKASGRLAVLDTNARPLDITVLNEVDLLFAILRWSALPGASRHHWGTDLDVFDAACLPPGYEVDLVPAEVDAGGMFAPFHEWLDSRIASGTSFGFFRPYDQDRNGVAPERWHISLAPVASEYMRLVTPDLLRQAIEPADMMLKDTVLANIDEIFERFVINVNPGVG